MKEKILAHRDKMNYQKGRLAIETKLIEELTELKSELYIPTSNNNLRKEIGDSIIMIYALCDILNLSVEDIVDETIAINERR